MNRLKRGRDWLTEHGRLIPEKSLGVARTLHRLWRTHVDRLLSEPGYVQALRDLVRTAIDLFAPAPMVRYLADQILTVYVALLRLVFPRRWDAFEDPGGIDWA